MRSEDAPGAITVTVPLVIWREGERFVSYSPALDLSSCGASEKEAERSFAEAVSALIETANERGCLEELLETYGWTRQGGEWRVPCETARGSIPFEFTLPRS